MSNTKRKHWYYGSGLRDGFFNKYYPKHFYYSKKDKAPYVDTEELEIYCWLYVFDDMWDLDEGYYCATCGKWLTKCEHEAGWCEC